MREIDLMAVQAKSDEKTKNDLIEKYDNFILRCASSAAHDYVSRSDAEWFIALAAFSEAIKYYSIHRGGFINFAELLMRRRVIDFIRSQSWYAPEISINESLFDVESDEECITIESEDAENASDQIDNSLKLEIELANDIFSSYGFTFFDLTECSPKAKRAKKACARAVAYIIKNPILVSNMKVKKLLPMKTIKRNEKISMKVLDRYEKYIMAAVEIISGDYPCLAEYMRFIKEEFENESSCS